MLANTESSDTLTEFDVADSDNMLVTVMRNQRVNWGFHIYYVYNNSDKRVNFKGRPESSFTVNSTLTLGGIPTEKIKSFPGNIGPLHFSHLDTYELPDSKLHMSAFHQGQSLVIYKTIPIEFEGRSSKGNMYYIRQEDRSNVSSIRMRDGNNFVTADVYPPPGRINVPAGRVLDFIPAPSNNKYNGIPLERFRKSGVITFTVGLIFCHLASPSSFETLYRFDVYGKTFSVDISPVFPDGKNYVFLNRSTLNIPIRPLNPIGEGNFISLSFQIFPSTGQLFIKRFVTINLPPINLQLSNLPNSDKVPQINPLDPYSETMEFYFEAGSSTGTVGLGINDLFLQSG